MEMKKESLLMTPSSYGNSQNKGYEVPNTNYQNYNPQTTPNQDFYAQMNPGLQSGMMRSNYTPMGYNNIPMDGQQRSMGNLANTQ